MSMMKKSGNRKYINQHTFAAYLAAGIILIVIGLGIFLSFFTVRRTATITNVGTGSYGGETYCVYDFEYEYNGTTRQGYGDDDDFTFAVGQTYPVYVHIINGDAYAFQNHNIVCYIFTAIFLCAGVVVLVMDARGYKVFKELLAEIGDANKDGIVDEHDIEYHDKMLQGKAEGVKKAAQENAYFEKKAELKCPYCDTIISPNDKFCQNCGAALGKK